MNIRLSKKRSFPGLLFFLCIAMHGYAQDSTFVFPPGAQLCDTTAWSLVFSDDFNSTNLDRKKWHSFNVWAGMHPKEHQNWGGARLIGSQCIAKDENVVLVDGVCSLILKKETTSWKCDTCTTSHTRPYSTGQIATYYTQRYRYGKFEARIRFPNFRWAHSTFWTWPGEGGSENDLPELDIAEAYGYKGVPVAGNNGFKHIEWATHRWRSGGRGSIKQSRRFPRQTFAAWLRGNYFDFSKWHTYTAEWDEARIAFYLDGELVDEVWRYRCEDGQGGFVPSGCEPGARRCNEDPAWPTSDFTAGGNIRLTLDIDEDKIEREGEVGRMDIDYVRVWQREPG